MKNLHKAALPVDERELLKLAVRDPGLVVAGPAMDTALALLAVVGLAISIGTAVLLPVGERVLRTLAALLIFAAFVNLCVIVGNIAVRAFRP